MAGMREISRSYYERASEEEKKSIKEAFTKLDVNGDGKISLVEFKKTVRSWPCAEAVFDFSPLGCNFCAKEMEELREIAKARYHAGSPQVQALAYEFFRSMDSDGDGRVDLSEFLTFIRQEGHSYMQNSYFFNLLDVDSNGTLDFFEVMTLYYIVKSGRPFCNCCGIFIPGIYFSCVECFKNPKTSFHLCRDCHRTATCNHNHYGRTQFLDNHTLLQAMRDKALAQPSQAWNKPTDAIVPFQHQPMYNTYVVHPHNAVVPASSNSNWEKWKAALKAFEFALSIGSVSSTLCTIL